MNDNRVFPLWQLCALELIPIFALFGMAGLFALVGASAGSHEEPPAMVNRIFFPGLAVCCVAYFASGIGWMLGGREAVGAAIGGTHVGLLVVGCYCFLAALGNSMRCQGCGDGWGGVALLCLGASLVMPALSTIALLVVRPDGRVTGGQPEPVVLRRRVVARGG
jgi:hypothetical protein